MKVAMIGHKVIPSRRGGIENVLTTLCPLLSDMGADVTCYNRSSDRMDDEYVSRVDGKTYRGVTLKKAWTIKKRGISAMIASFTAAIAAAFGDYDIVHFHAEGPCAAMWIPKLFGKRCVATVHGLDWQRAKWGKGFAAKYIKFGERMMVKYADEIIVLSVSAQEYFRITYGRETTLINNGIEKQEKKAAEKITEGFGLTKDSYICSVCRLTEEKGIHYLIDAYNSIKTDKKLVIAGDTSDTDEYVAMLKRMAAYNSNIIFTGFISGDILKEIYSNAYLVVIPSDIEGMSLSLLEALAYGNAVLCSDIPENTLVTEEKAIHFEKGNVDDLTVKLEELCHHTNLVEALRKNVEEFILQKYNWLDVAEATYSLYRRIAKPPKPKKTKEIKMKKGVKKTLIAAVAAFLAAFALFSAVIGVSYMGNRQFRERFYSVSSLKVNNKIRVIQISDLHNCTYGYHNARLIDRVSKLDPDIILLTGDSIDSDYGTADQVVVLCATLAEIAPTYYIYGNNEVESQYPMLFTQEALDAQLGFNDQTRDPQKLLDMSDPFAEKLTAAGVTVLKNSTATLTVGNTPVDIYGVLTSNPSAFWPYAGESFHDYLYTEETHFKITAIHEPMIFEEFEPDYWGDVMLAGHTHGGLVKIPMIGALYTREGGLLPGRSGHYVYGRYEVQGRPLIVSSGLENRNVFRINNEPELVIIDINKF